MRLLTLPFRYWWATTVIVLVVYWLSIASLDCGSYDPKPWHICHWTWQYHGWDVVICLDDMTFVRTAGPRRGERCRIVLPEKLR
jgi:hypothetical protein